MKGFELVRRSFDDVERKGFHTLPRTPFTYAALFHSEVSEALEEIRDGAEPVWFNRERGIYDCTCGKRFYSEYSGVQHCVASGGEHAFRAWTLKPEGVPIELIDLAIRIGDFAGTVGWFKEGDIIFYPDYLRKRWRDSEMIRSTFMKRLHMETPADFLEVLHIEIDRFAVEMERLDTHSAKTTLGIILEYIVYYFEYRGWEFERLFELKMAYNGLRPFRHGDKTL